MFKKPIPNLIWYYWSQYAVHGWAKRFREVQKTFPETPVALLSGVAEIQDVQQTMDLGAIRLFPKTLSGRAMLKQSELVLSGENLFL